MWSRAWNSGAWSPRHQLLLHVEEGGSTAPRALSWGTVDGAQFAVVMSLDLTSCYGHHVTAGRDVVEVRGELHGRPGDPPHMGDVGGYEFDAEIEDTAGTSANDAPDRDPRSWALHGSTDGNLWRILDCRGAVSRSPTGTSPGHIGSSSNPDPMTDTASTSPGTTVPRTCNLKPCGSSPGPAVSLATATARAMLQSRTGACVSHKHHQTCP
ncbi:hypothetical protein [Streptomyces coerulescens]|uniref:OAA-family lectin sugar binding domain-containing protein n=1 Tax=Streptomyces coerulescens TaxID=29304 RepID=A0ABW0CUU6_STRCD